MSTFNQEYSEFVQSRCKSGGAILDSLTAEKAHLLHMAVGLAGEATELLAANSLDNVYEELGDLLFYQSALERIAFNKGHVHVARLSLREAGFELSLDLFRQLAVACGVVLDIAKKTAIYAKSLDRDLLCDALLRADALIAGIAELNGTNTNTLRHINREKLEERYSSGAYSDKEASLRRDKKSEVTNASAS